MLVSSLRVLIALSMIFSMVGCSFIYPCGPGMGRDKTGETIDNTWSSHQQRQYGDNRDY